MNNLILDILTNTINKFLNILFHRKKKFQIFSSYIILSSKMNKKYRTYEKNAMLNAFIKFKKSKVGKKIIKATYDTTKVKLILTPTNFKDLGISEELYNRITKEFNQELFTKFDEIFTSENK